jgi:hypothetical protein
MLINTVLLKHFFSVNFLILIKMKKIFSVFKFLFLLVFGIQVAFAQTTTVTLDFSTDPEWDGSGNTGNIAPPVNDYGYRNVEGVTGVYPQNSGCIGGVFARSIAFSYYADTELNGTLNRTMTFKMAGSFYIENRSSSAFDGNFFLGYFDATNPARDNFIGITFVEPSGGAEAPFRGFTGVNGPGGVGTGIIGLTQLIPLTFDLTWTGSADGSGIFSGTLAGQDVNLTVAAGTGTFNSFGLMCGGASTDANLRTRNCYFDNLTYTKISASSVDEQPLNRVSIYPNITTDKVYFNNLPEGSRIVMVDLVGKILVVKRASELGSGLSLQSCANGLYLINVMQGQEIKQSVKVLKQ